MPTPSGRPTHDESATKSLLTGATSLMVLSGVSIMAGQMAENNISAAPKPAPAAPAMQTAESFLGAAPALPSVTGGLS